MKLKVATERVCLRCDFKWRSKLERPKYCPRCKQAKWDTPARTKKVVLRPARKTQDEIFDTIGNSAQVMHEALNGIMMQSGLSLENFAEKIGTTAEKLAPYLDGSKPVTDEQLRYVRSVIR